LPILSIVEGEARVLQCPVSGKARFTGQDSRGKPFSAGHQKNMKKSQIVFTLLLGLLTFVVSYFLWNTSFEVMRVFSKEGLVVPFLLGIFLISLLCLFSYLNDNLLLALFFGLISGSSLLVLVLPPYSLISFLLVILVFFFLNLQTKYSKRDFFRPNPHRSLNGVSFAFSLLIITICALYYPIAIESSSEFKVNIPDNLYQSLTQNLLTKFVGDSENNQNLNNFAEESFNAQIPSLVERLNQQGIVDEKIIAQEINQLKKDFLKEIQNRISSPDQPGFLEVGNLKKVVESQIEAFIKPYRSYLPLTLTVSLFFSLTFFGWLVVPLSLILTQLYIKILTAFGVLKIEKEITEVQRINFA